jgi:hypothetical protein
MLFFYLFLYSFCTNIDNSVLLSVFPVKIYANADIQKMQILKENKGKSGVYRWVNKETGKSYVGSGTKSRAKPNLLARRFYNYYSAALLIKHDCMVINRALLKSPPARSAGGGRVILTLLFKLLNIANPLMLLPENNFIWIY